MSVWTDKLQVAVKIVPVVMLFTSSDFYVLSLSALQILWYAVSRCFARSNFRLSLKLCNQNAFQKKWTHIFIQHRANFACGYNVYLSQIM